LVIEKLKNVIGNCKIFLYFNVYHTYVSFTGLNLRLRDTSNAMASKLGLIRD